MAIIVPELFGLAVLAGLLIFVWRRRQESARSVGSGWPLIFGGLVLMFAGGVLEIGENFDSPGRFEGGGGMPIEALVAKFVGRLGGIVLIAVGLIRLIRAVPRLDQRTPGREPAAKAPRDDEQHYRRIIDLAPDAIFVHVDNRIVFANPAMLKMMETDSVDPLIGLNALDVMHPDHRDRIMAIRAEIGNRAQPVDLEEVVYRTLGGKDVNVEGSAAPLVWEGRDAIMVVARDITERKRNEGALRDRERRIRRITDAVPGAIAYVTRDHRIGFANQRFADLVRIPEDRLIGMHVRDVRGEKAYREGLAYLETALSGEEVTYERESTGDDGTPIYFLAHYVPHFADDDEVLGIYVLILDITDHKLAEEAVRDSEARYRAIVEDQTELIARSAPDHTLTFVNDAYCRYFGMGREELIGSSLLDHVPAEDVPLVTARIASLSGSNPVVSFEHRVIVPGGEVRWNHWSDRAILDADGEVVEIQAVGRDVDDRKRAENALRDSEARYRGIVEDQTELIGRALPDGTLTYVNEAFCRYFGKSRDELIGETFYQFIPAGDRLGVQESLSGMTPENPVATVEHRVIAKGGEIRWQQWTDRLLCDADGRAVELQAVGRDITERKMAQDALKRSEETFSRAFNASPDSLLITRKSDAVVVDANDRFLQVTGLSRDEVIGKPIGESSAWANPDDRKRYVEILESSGECNDFEADFRARDGRVVTVLLSARPIEVDGRPCLLSITRDITQRRRAEEALRESEARYRGIMDNVADGVVTIDEDGVVQTFNVMAERIFGYAAEEVVGRNVRMLMTEPDRGRHDDYLETFLETGNTELVGKGPREVTARRKDGSTFPLELSIAEMVHGDRRSFIGAMRDVTERKDAAEQLRHAQKMEAIGQLTGGIAHDFNNLLAIVLGNLQLLERRVGDDPDLRELAETAIEASRRGGALTRQLLAFSRRQPLEPQVLDLNGLIVEASDLLSRTLGERYTVETELAPGLWHTLADPAQVQNALLNLVLNASHAMPAGGTITIETANAVFDEGDSDPQRGLSPGAYVRLAVRDPGTGMLPEVVDRAFDPFFTTKEVGQGSGLGLSMVYGFARQSGGDARIESRFGEGTTVTLYLPRAAEGDPERSGRGLSAAPGPPGGGETVLVVEDNAGVRDVAVKLLHGLGYRVLEAESGAEANRILSTTGEIDVLFTDIVLPEGMSGSQLAVEAQRRDSGIKVLLTSGNSDVGPLGGCATSSGFAFLRKPYLAADLASTLRALLDRDRRHP